MMIRMCLTGLLTLAVTIPVQTQTREFRIFREGIDEDLHFRWSGQNQLDRVQDLLDLTESQVVSLEALQTDRRNSTKTQTTELREKRQALAALVPLGNATDVGTAYLAMLGASGKLSEVQKQFQADFANLLTTDQKELLETLKKAGGGTIFRMLGLTDTSGEFMMFGDGELLEFGFSPHP